MEPVDLFHRLLKILAEKRRKIKVLRRYMELIITNGVFLLLTYMELKITIILN